MAVTIANVSHPNQDVWEGEFLGQKARVIDVTFDNSYDNTNGEQITAATLGLQGIYGAFVIAEAWSGTTTDTAVITRPVINSTKDTLSLRAFYYDSTSVTGKQAFEEVGNAVNLSAFTVRLCVIGV